MTATWAGWAKIETLIRSAGTGLSSPIKDVRRGRPWSVSGRMIRYWYEGTTSSPFGSDTLTQTQDGLKVAIGLFLPMSGAGSPTSDAALDSLAEEADAAIQAALFGDAFLGVFDSTNSANGVAIEDSTAEAVNFGAERGGVVLYVSIPLTYGIPDHATIAP